jgi:hypothetical protein
MRLAAAAFHLLMVIHDYPALSSELPEPWSLHWWYGVQGLQSDGVTRIHELSITDPPPPDDGSGVRLSIVHPKDKVVNRYIPTLGDLVPEVSLRLEDEGWLADAVRANASAYSICLSLDGQFLACAPLGGGGELPRMHPDSRRGLHVLRVWLARRVDHRGWGKGQTPLPSATAVATSRFMTQMGALGTGCRSVANWFLAAVPPAIPIPIPGGGGAEAAEAAEAAAPLPRGLMGAWYYAMERRWRELLDLQNRTATRRDEEAGDAEWRSAQQTSERGSVKPPYWRKSLVRTRRHRYLTIIIITTNYQINHNQ